MSVPLVAVSDDFALEYVREERRRPMPLVVVGHGAAAPFLQRQAGLRAIQGLNLALLVDAQHDRLVGRIEVEADYVSQLFDKPRVAGQLEILGAMRLEVVAAP